MRSEIGKGTQFIIFIPCEAALEETTVPTVVEDITGHGKVVLLVDDEVEILDALEKILSDKDYQTLSASNGVEALELFEQHRDRIDVLLTDVIMPGMSGIDLIQKAKDLKPSLKVVAMSGLETMGSLEEKLGEHCVDGHLFKPFGFADLLQTLHDV